MNELYLKVEDSTDLDYGLKKDSLIGATSSDIINELSISENSNEFKIRTLNYIKTDLSRKKEELENFLGCKNDHENKIFHYINNYLTPNFIWISFVASSGKIPEDKYNDILTTHATFKEVYEKLTKEYKTTEKKQELLTEVAKIYDSGKVTGAKDGIKFILSFNPSF